MTGDYTMGRKSADNFDDEDFGGYEDFSKRNPDEVEDKEDFDEDYEPRNSPKTKYFDEMFDKIPDEDDVDEEQPPEDFEE